MSTYSHQVEYVTREILQGLCGLHATPVPAGDLELGERGCVLGVEFSGAFGGELVLECSSALALTATSQAMATSPAALSEAEIRDVLQEIVNIAAGNLKAVLPRPTTFSFARSTLPVGPAASELAGQASLDVAGEPIRLTLFNRRRAAEGAPASSRNLP